MLRKKTTDAAIAPPPVSKASKSTAKTTPKTASVSPESAKPARKAAPRKKATPVAEVPAESLAKLSEAVETPVLSAREIEERAYLAWLDRGCPMGSPQEDWYRAERELIASYTGSSK
jgi:hypothetical protein